MVQEFDTNLQSLFKTTGTKEEHFFYRSTRHGNFGNVISVDKHKNADYECIVKVDINDGKTVQCVAKLNTFYPMQEVFINSLKGTRKVRGVSSNGLLMTLRQFQDKYPATWGHMVDGIDEMQKAKQSAINGVKLMSNRRFEALANLKGFEYTALLINQNAEFELLTAHSESLTRVNKRVNAVPESEVKRFTFLKKETKPNCYYFELTNVEAFNTSYSPPCFKIVRDWDSKSKTFAFKKVSDIGNPHAKCITDLILKEADYTVQIDFSGEFQSVTVEFNNTSLFTFEEVLINTLNALYFIIL